MTKIAYTTENFKPKSLKIIKQADAILEDYRRQGYTLTLRQLYYQFVARGLLTEDAGWVVDKDTGSTNNERNYKNLGSLVTNARNGGYLSWTAIEDRGRNCVQWASQEDEDAVLDGIEFGFSIDRWARQDSYVEVWVEKDALTSVVERPCRRLHVPYMGCKGYLSASEAWRAGVRFQKAREAGKRCVLIHLGDHDPEGIDMTRDNGARVELYSFDEVEVRRIALNMDQVQQYNPPPNYAKASSSRFNGYVAAYGEECWELDALEPAVIDRLIADTVRLYIDPDAWNECDEEESIRRAAFVKLRENWDSVKEFLDGID